MKVADIAGDRVRAEVERLCRMGLDFEALCREATGRLREFVPFEMYVMMEMDPLSGLPAGIAHSEGLASEEEARLFFERVYFEDDVNEYGWMERKGLTVARLSDGTGGKLERALRHREFNAPKGFGYELRAVLGANGRAWGGLCLLREKGDRDFDERELSFLARLSPHIGAGLRDAALRRERRLEPADEASGILLLDRDGRVTHRTAAAERLLGELGASRGALPTAVWGVVGALRRAPRNSAPRLCVSGRSGRWISLQASLTEPGDGHPAETAVVIASATPQEIARLYAGAHGLSEREKEVVSLVMRGASTRDISRALYIAESTVQGHLSHVFDKVGVKSRRELLKRLFLDDMQPAL